MSLAASCAEKSSSRSDLSGDPRKSESRGEGRGRRGGLGTWAEERIVMSHPNTSACLDVKSLSAALFARKANHSCHSSLTLTVGSRCHADS